MILPEDPSRGRSPPERPEEIISKNKDRTMSREGARCGTLQGSWSFGDHQVRLASETPGNPTRLSGF